MGRTRNLNLTCVVLHVSLLSSVTHIRFREILFTVSSLRFCERLPRKAAQYPSLEAFSIPDLIKP